MFVIDLQKCCLRRNFGNFNQIQVHASHSPPKADAFRRTGKGWEIPLLRFRLQHHGNGQKDQEREERPRHLHAHRMFSQTPAAPSTLDVEKRLNCCSGRRGLVAGRGKWTRFIFAFFFFFQEEWRLLFIACVWYKRKMKSGKRWAIIVTEGASELQKDTKAESKGSMHNNVITW